MGAVMGPFETERLFLRQMQTADGEILRELIYSDEEVWGMYSNLGNNLPELEARLIYHSHQPVGSTLGRLVVELKSTGQVIGQVHLDPYVNDYSAVPGDLPSPCHAIEVELAFAFGKKYWGQGLAYEACQCLVEYAFGTLKLPRLVGAARLANERSVNLQKRLGFQLFPDTPTHEASSSPDSSEAMGWVTVLTNPLLFKDLSSP
jgi:ribosomal-protein-alanine N-acetyltransferase